MFKNLNNIQRSFAAMRLITIISIIVSPVIAALIVIYSFNQIESQAENIYILDQGSIIKALRQNMSSNREVEARSNIVQFHELFFNLVPDQTAINAQIKQALYRCDKSVYDYFLDLKENNYYHRLIVTNGTQRIEIDSIALNMDTYPYTAAVFARQKISRKTNITWRKLTTTCELTNTPGMSRSENNPHGFMINNFKIIENNELTREDL